MKTAVGKVAVTTMLIARGLGAATGSDGGIFQITTSANGSIYFGTVSPGSSGGFMAFDYLAIGPNITIAGLNGILNTPNLDPRLLSGLTALGTGPLAIQSLGDQAYKCQAQLGISCPSLSPLTLNGIGFSTGASAPFTQIPPTVPQVLQTAQSAGLLGSVNLALTPTSSTQQGRGNITFTDLIGVNVPIGDQVFETQLITIAKRDTLFELDIRVGSPGTPPPVSTPEPGTWGLCGTGLLAAVLVPRYRRRGVPGQRLHRPFFACFQGGTVEAAFLRIVFVGLAVLTGARFSTAAVLLSANLTSPDLKLVASMDTGHAMTYTPAGVVFTKTAGVTFGRIALTTTFAVPGDFTASVVATRTMLSEPGDMGLVANFQTSGSFADVFLLGAVAVYSITPPLDIIPVFDGTPVATLRLSRIGSTVSEGYDPGTGFVSLQSKTDPSFLGPVGFQIFLQQEDVSPAGYQGSFRNFVITTPDQGPGPGPTPSPVPEPSSMSLMALGTGASLLIAKLWGRSGESGSR